MLLVIDSRYFDSVIVTSMRDDVHSDYGGETLQELRDRYSNPHLITVTPERIAFMLKRYDKALSQPFEEISQERYYDLMDYVPPKRFSRNRFFVGEAYSGEMYDLCFRIGDRYFKALRDIRLSDEEITSEINAFAKKLKKQPKLIKGEAVRTPNGWHNRKVLQTPYYFQLGKRKLFLYNLISDTGSDYDDRRYRREMAERLLNLRKNRYDYCIFYSRKSDIFEFFKWLRENHYTLEVHGSLFGIDPDRGYVDFHGNVCEYSAAFHYRIYSRELFENIIHQLRRVKRHTAWLPNPKK